MTTDSERSRRQFLLTATAAGGGLLAAGIGGTAHADEPAPAAKSAAQAAEDIAPPEDLMREHGVLRRILLIYEEYARRCRDREWPDSWPVFRAAKIVRSFIEDYHEKLEEDYLFPRFEKAGKLVELVKTLREQHQAGRRLSEQIIERGAPRPMEKTPSGGDSKLSKLLAQFSRMYRPHAAREDTVLFPAIRGLMTAKEFDELGDRFEEKEHKLFARTALRTSWPRWRRSKKRSTFTT